MGEKGNLYYPSFIEFKDLSKGITVEQGKVGVTLKGKRVTVDDLLKFAKNYWDTIIMPEFGLTAENDSMDGITYTLPIPNRSQRKQIVKTGEWLNSHQNNNIHNLLPPLMIKIAESQEWIFPGNPDKSYNDYNNMGLDFYKSLETGIPRFIFLQSVPAQWKAIENDYKENSGPYFINKPFDRIKQTVARKSCILNLSLLELMKTIYALPRDKQWDILNWLSSVQRGQDEIIKSFSVSVKEYKYGRYITKKINSKDYRSSKK